MTIHEVDRDPASASLRKRRTDAERVRPNRAPRHQLEQEAKKQLNGLKEGRAGLASAVDHGVELGYRLIEEQIRKGRQSAEQWSGPSEGRSGHDWQQIASRMLNIYRDLGAVYLDATESLILNAAKFAGEHRGADEPDREATPRDRGLTKVSVMLRSSRPASIDVDLQPGASDELVVLPLHSLENRGEEIDEVSLEASPGGSGGLRACVSIPDACREGAYMGIVVDRRTGMPAGTLSVRIEG
jgi:hypothetical protein